ncbi:YopN family type III secretion system gatekeeper subunit [Serratia proteamaculans]|uniref:type III secretion system gatekeeper subunit SctW n=1 Tax=Serratia proteamaculans TaxID=28151 RepID=UPI0010765611|nr:type III secretion system gatekeeper subunit SctW [Serratia proteamaculans]TFZ48689.1 YopN family type III secretion system gatekeeper subunit [Serratia proteamaculans]
MEISYRPKPLGVLSPKQLAKEDTRRAEGQRNTSQPEVQAEETDFRPNQQLEFANKSDDFASVLAQFRNRRDLEKKSAQLADSFERVLDEEVSPKAKQILQVARLQKISLAELLNQARKLFPDDSDLILVLRELLRRKKLPEVVAKRLQELMQQVEEQADPKTLKAGINCALKARLFGKALALRPGLLRASYRQFLQSEASEIDIYADWIGSYGFQRRVLVLDFIENALVTDCNSLDASCSSLEFGYLLARLGQLKLLRSADALFVNRLLANTVVQTFNPHEEVWLLLMLSLLQQPDELDALLAETVGGSALFRRHYEHSSLLHVLYLACKALPTALFLDESGRDVVLETLRHMATIAYQHEQVELRREAENASFDRIYLDE